MPRPQPTDLFHITHVRNLVGIVNAGLMSDTDALALGSTEVDIGEQAIKVARRVRTVDAGPGGVVADYAPFYFAPRSPMMFSINCGNVDSYRDGCGPIVYLRTTLERVHELGLSWVVSDRNARLGTSRFTTDPATLDDHVDWALMEATYWNNTPERPDRKELRMAKCLVHRSTPWEAFLEVATKSESVARVVRQATNVAEHKIEVTVRGGWYF